MKKSLTGWKGRKTSCQYLRRNANNPSDKLSQEASKSLKRVGFQETGFLAFFPPVMEATPLTNTGVNCISASDADHLVWLVLPRGRAGQPCSGGSNCHEENINFHLFHLLYFNC